MTKTDLQTVLFQSTIPDEQLLKYLQDKNMKKYTEKSTETKNDNNIENRQKCQDI